MPDFFATLDKVLELEKEKKFQDLAVSGGFTKFTAFINQYAEKNHSFRPVAKVLIRVFSSYHYLSQSDREAVVLRMLSLVKQYPEGLNELLNEIETILSKTEDSKSETQQMQDHSLYADIQSIRGIGSRNYIKLNKLGLGTVYDVLRFFPRRYQDFSSLKTIDQIVYGEDLSVIGTITTAPHVRLSKSGKLKIVESSINDTTGILRLTWFNKPFLVNQLKVGMTIIVSGKVDVYMGRLVINNPEWEPLDSHQLNTNRIVPIYPLTAGISQRQLRMITNNAVTVWAQRIQEYLPDEILKEEGLLGIQDAIRQIHFPDSNLALQSARDRFAFEEIFFLQLGVFTQKQDWESQTARKLSLPHRTLQSKIDTLPFKLTNAQIRALHDIQADLNSGKPMNRLLQGDVGSGKTVVARLAIEFAIANQSQAAVMAPTAILAEQHYRTLRAMFVESGSMHADEIALLTGSTSEKTRKKILGGLENGNIKVIVGTHALIEEPVVFRDLQLAVIDEQHRFGVAQRALLRQKGESPHLLVMTATPIPRSLALTIYGDMDISTIDEMPAGRLPVETRIIYPNDRELAYNLISCQINNGFQAFIIYPMIEAEENDDYLAVVNEYERISQKIFPMYSVGFLHGKLKSAEKERIMKDFRDGKYQVLISTTVIEVGVDIPNAAVVLVEGANRFGLAQLHQIRGRVRRSDHPSYCLLIPDGENAAENERLQAMIKTNDGFKLADFDLQQRGPGEFLGSRQSGYIKMQFASFTDTRLVERCRKQSLKIINSDALFKKPEHHLLKNELTFRWPELKLN